VDGVEHHAVALDQGLAGEGVADDQGIAVPVVARDDDVRARRGLLNERAGLAS